MEAEKALKEFGLNQKQAKIYLATLELGSATVNRIAKKAGIARSSSYDILEELVKIGIASQMTKKKILYFAVEEPKKVVTLAKQKAEILETALPQLNAIYGLAKNRPQVRFFQGKESIKQIYHEIIEDKKEGLIFSSVEDLFSKFKEIHLNFVEQRKKNSIPVRILIRDSELARKRQASGVKDLRTIKILPKTYPHQGFVATFGNKIAYFSFVNDYVAVIIESKELADIQRAMFEYLWDSID